MTAVEAQDKALGDALHALTRRVDEVAAASQSALAASQSRVRCGGRGKERRRNRSFSAATSMR